MNCSNCGAPLKENAEFCDVCGANQPSFMRKSHWQKTTR
ncbi:MAG: zinc ribbon domain-containing protein [Clostridia bacterium]|nr:zinc ribbon domain-containing protein [Clostridia bacterium]